MFEDWFHNTFSNRELAKMAQRYSQELGLQIPDVNRMGRCSLATLLEDIEATAVRREIQLSV